MASYIAHLLLFGLVSQRLPIALTQPENPDEHLSSIAESEVMQGPIGQRIVGDVVDKDDDQRQSTTEIQT